jgi:hypothetical protein
MRARTHATTYAHTLWVFSNFIPTVHIHNTRRLQDKTPLHRADSFLSSWYSLTQTLCILWNPTVRYCVPTSGLYPDKINIQPISSQTISSRSVLISCYLCPSLPSGLFLSDFTIPLCLCLPSGLFLSNFTIHLCISLPSGLLLSNFTIHLCLCLPSSLFLSNFTIHLCPRLPSGLLLSNFTIHLCLCLPSSLCLSIFTIHLCLSLQVGSSFQILWSIYA